VHSDDGGGAATFVPKDAAAGKRMRLRAELPFSQL
jgi:hypothetical protein